MKKKGDPKVALPSVGIQQPTQTSKNYSPKSNLNKLREIDERGIYFEMPTIHQNELSMKTPPANDSPLRVLQDRVLGVFEGWKEAKLVEEWQLYITKSDITALKSTEIFELEEFLVQMVLKLSRKLQSSASGQGFSFSLPNRSSDLSGLKQQLAGGSLAEQYTKTMLLDDPVIGERRSDRSSKGGRSTLQDKSKMVLNSDKSAVDVAEFNALNHQNVVLEKQVGVYSSRIQELESCLMIFEDKLKEMNGEKDNTNELMETMILKNKYKYDSEVKTMQVEALTSEVTNNRRQVQLLTLKNQQLEKQYKVLTEENARFREYLKFEGLWKMATEQALGWRVRFDECREDNAKLQGKIKMLKDKNKQLLNYFNMSNLANPDQEEDKHDLDKVIKEFKEWLQVISVPKVGQGSEAPQQKELAFGEVNAKLLRPNFYIFFQAFESTLLMEKNIINIRPIEYSFFLKIRTIFDTLFQTFQLASHYKEYPSFPQYVVGFLEKYQINPASGKLQFRKKAIENQEKITFLVNLFNKGLCNTWECQIFKTFLFENCYLDEVYFFLDCRNEINSGLPSSHSLGAADAISYVKLNKALRVVVKKLAPYENYIIERVKNILKSKKKVKYGESFIDKYFVLKILLEVYGLEKAKSERIFETSFKARKKKQFITYENYHHFMATNFPHLTSVEVAELYRETYMLSSGHPTYKTIHYVCGMRGLFIPLLLLKRRGKGHLEQSLNNDMLLLDMQNNLTKLSPHLEELGVERFMHVEHSLNEFMRQLDYYKTNKSAFYQRLHQEKAGVVRLNTLLETTANYLANPTELVEESDVQSQMIQLHSLLHQADAHVHCIARHKERRGKAMGMLVRNFKIRIQESMLQFEKINENEIDRLKNKIEQDQRDAEGTPDGEVDHI